MFSKRVIHLTLFVVDFSIYQNFPWFLIVNLLSTIIDIFYSLLIVYHSWNSMKRKHKSWNFQGFFVTLSSWYNNFGDMFETVEMCWSCRSDACEKQKTFKSSVWKRTFACCAGWKDAMFFRVMYRCIRYWSSDIVHKLSSYDCTASERTDSVFFTVDSLSWMCQSDLSSGWIASDWMCIFNPSIDAKGCQTGIIAVSKDGIQWVCCSLHRA